MNEHEFSWEMIERTGYERRLAYPGGSISVPVVIGAMTGLDMTKYDVETDFNARMFRLVRKAA